MSHRYFILLTRDDTNSPWQMEFGDYIRAVVAQELDDWCDSNMVWRKKAERCRIVECGDSQAAIDEAVASMNK